MQSRDEGPRIFRVKPLILFSRERAWDGIAAIPLMSVKESVSWLPALTYSLAFPLALRLTVAVEDS